MDIQMLIVIVCIAAAVLYFARRMYRSVKSGKCACCDDGNQQGRGTACSCGCTQRQKVIITKFDAGR